MNPLDHESALRLGGFVGVLAVMALWEALAPRRTPRAGRSTRWPGNLGLVVVNTLVIRLVLPLGAVGVALLAEQRGWGLFNQLDVSAWLALLLSVIALDLVIYGQHVLFHVVPALWEIHRVHHADPDFDVTTGVRFHPVEVALSMGLKAAAVIALGAPPLAVLLFEVLLNASALFNHANVRLPAWLDGVLRLVLVTPDMHRVHHSILPQEANRNFGFNLPWWDYLFRTYRPQPAAGHDGMTIGVADVHGRRARRLPWLLALPFLGLFLRVPRPSPPAARQPMPR